MSENPRSFYTERIPAQFNRALERQEARGEDGRALLEDMRAVDGTLKVVVEGEDGGVFYLNIRGGRMAAGETAAHPPFLTLVHDQEAFPRLRDEAGESALGFLGGLAGLAGDMKLTRARLANLAGLEGAMRFTLTGTGGFSLLTHFGPGEPPEEAACSIAVDADAYRQLRSGELNPQDAFLGGHIRVDGDMQMAMQLALAALSPD